MAQVKSQKRIGNIEYRTVVSFSEHKYVEIIHWVPNSLYGKEDEFEKSSLVTQLINKAKISA